MQPIDFNLAPNRVEERSQFKKISSQFYMGLLAFLAFANQGFGARFEIKDVAQRSSVVFTASALIEKVIGVSYLVQGWIELDPDQKDLNVKGEVTVDTRVFNTGNELRNELLREMYLKSSEFPYASFRFEGQLPKKKGKKAQQAKANPLKVWVVKLVGPLGIRGVVKERTVMARVAYFPQSELTKDTLPGNLIRISAELDIASAEHEIPWIAEQRARVAKSAHLVADLIATDQLPAPQIPVIDLPKPKQP